MNKTVSNIKKLDFKVAADRIVSSTKNVSFTINMSAIVSSIKKSLMAFFISFPAVLDTPAILDIKAIFLITNLSQDKLL